MKKKLEVLLAVLIIAVVGVLAWTGKTYYDDKEKSNSVANNKAENNASSNETKTEEKTKEEPKKVEPEEQKNDEKEDQKEEKKEETSSTSNEDKAIELAKKEYGITDGGIYYRIDQIKSSTEYIVSVRNKDTSVLAWYIVDVSAGTVKDY